MAGVDNYDGPFEEVCLSELDMSEHIAAIPTEQDVEHLDVHYRLAVQGDIAELNKTVDITLQKYDTMLKKYLVGVKALKQQLHLQQERIKELETDLKQTQTLLHAPTFPAVPNYSHQYYPTVPNYIREDLEAEPTRYSLYSSFAN